jgi:hypothetical protein
MIEILPPFGKYRYDIWRILPMKCYIDKDAIHFYERVSTGITQIGAIV